MSQATDQYPHLQIQPREAAYPIEDIFLQRWSPRAYDASSMPMADLLSTLEAARWAPSAYNIQPWRFVYVLRTEDRWAECLDLLDPFNESWARHASALVFLVSDSVMRNDGSGSSTESRTHSFDAGAAWAHLALQATALGYQAHAMAGIHFDKVRQALSIPRDFRVEIAVAIGRQASPSGLPPALREREMPSSRLPLDAIAYAGRFPMQPTEGEGPGGSL